MIKIRLFRILYYLSKEVNPVLFAQDAYIVLLVCIADINKLPFAIPDCEARAGHDVDIQNVHLYRAHLASLMEMAASAGDILDHLHSLALDARTLWLCAPIDHTKGVGDAAHKLWKDVFKKGLPLEANQIDMINSLKIRLLELIQFSFPDLLSEMEEEERFEAQQKEALGGSSSYDMVNYLPIMWVEPTFLTTTSFICCTCFPNTHFQSIGEGFGELLGYSLARLLTVPFLDIATNNDALTDLSKTLNTDEVIDPHKALIISYRSSRRHLRHIFWEMCPDNHHGKHSWVGVDVTEQLEKSKDLNSTSTQKMLRQWLHSIRNASFEQQAAVLLDEVLELRQSLGNRSSLQTNFIGLDSGLQMLMKTAKRSVGLIDHALDTKGFIQLMPVHDFIENLSNVPMGATLLEGGVVENVRVSSTLNGKIVKPDDVAGLFVKCDILDIQAFVNLLISVSARYVFILFLTLHLECSDYTFNNICLFTLSDCLWTKVWK